MAINIRIRDGLCPDLTTGDGGATEGDIRGSFSDIIDVIGVKDLAGGHCLVTQNSPAALSVLVAPGVVYIPNADYDELDSNTVKFWEAIITVSTAVTITANTSGSTRIDLICAKMDTAVTPDEHASNIATLVAVAGTPGAGTPATPDNHYVLATVAVANGASTIVNADITSTRVQSKIDFDFLPKASGAEINTGTEDAKIVTPKAIADSKLADFIRGDGWISANETWTYASATTITVPSGAAAKYAKGDKIRLKQGAGYKYYVVSAVADTTLTIVGGSDYSVANETITDNYYSHQDTPIGYPNYFNTGSLTWNTGVVDNGTGGQQPTMNYSRFFVSGRHVFHYAWVKVAVKNTASAAFSFTIPATMPSMSTSPNSFGSSGIAIIGGIWVAGNVDLNSAEGNGWTVSIRHYAGTSINDNQDVGNTTFSYNYLF